MYECLSVQLDYISGQGPPLVSNNLLYCHWFYFCLSFVLLCVCLFDIIFQLIMGFQCLCVCSWSFSLFPIIFLCVWCVCVFNLNVFNSFVVYLNCILIIVVSVLLSCAFVYMSVYINKNKSHTNKHNFSRGIVSNMKLIKR